MARTNPLKNRRQVWLVLLALAASAVAAGFWVVAQVNERGDTGESVGVQPGSHGGLASRPVSPVQDYLRFAGVLGGQPTQHLGADPQYIAEGLRTLAGALGTLNLGSPDLQIDLRSAAEHLLLNPESTATSAVVREALVTTADAVETQNGKVRRMAESINPDRPLPEQQMTVAGFFRLSAEAMQKLTPQH